MTLNDSSSASMIPFFQRIFCIHLCLFCLIRFVLFCFVLFCFVLFCFDLIWFDLFCFVLFCFDLICFVLLCFVCMICFVWFVSNYLLKKLQKSKSKNCKPNPTKFGLQIDIDDLKTQLWNRLWLKDLRRRFEWLSERNIEWSFENAISNQKYENQN